MGKIRRCVMVSSQQLQCTIISMLPCNGKRDLSELQKVSAYELFIFPHLGSKNSTRKFNWMIRHIKIND
jgi:hypothetical protein